MGEGKRAAAHFDAIKKVLADDDKLIPLSPYDFFINGVISVLLFYFIPKIFIESAEPFTAKLIDATLWLMLPIISLTVIGKWLARHENEKMERIFSRNQLFYRHFAIFSSVAATVITLLLSSIGGWFAIPLLWFFVIGAQLMVMGFFTRKIILQVGRLYVVASALLGLLFFVIFVDTAGANSHVDAMLHLKIADRLFGIGQIAVMTLLPLGLFVIGFRLLKKP